MNHIRKNDKITSDMLDSNEDQSEIVEFYKDLTIFITGATGFLGKLFLEKILRTTDVHKIYILARSKKGKTSQDRLQEMCKGPCFEPLRKEKPYFLKKVEIINGDLNARNLGLNEEDICRLKEEVNCVIHCAATVRFDEALRIATNINVRSVRDLLNIAKEMKNLKSMLCVSTAYANCVRNHIEEKFYDPPMTADQIITLVDSFDDEKLLVFAPSILSDYPNTYVFTKAIAESVIREEAKHLPVAVFRPAMVIASVKEPVPGFIDNMYGPVFVFIGGVLGLFRSMHCKPNYNADVVPVDYVINSGLAIAWDTANKNNSIVGDAQDLGKSKDRIPIYNYVSSSENPLTWAMFTTLSSKYSSQVPSVQNVWHFVFVLSSSVFWYNLSIFLLHTIPGYLVDFLALCLGKKRMFVKYYDKFNTLCKVVGYFTNRQWEFNNDNVQNLWKKMKQADQQKFEFSMKLIDWDKYFYNFLIGARIYVLKDPIETLPKGKIRYYKLMVAHYLLMTIFGTIGLWLVFKLFNAVFLIFAL